MGLADFDRDAHQRSAATGTFVGGTWGRWSARGNAVQVVYPSNITEVLEPSRQILKVDTNSALGKREFVRSPDLSGLVLDGAYTYNSNPDDPYYDQPGCRQIIAFTRDGRFVDKGIFTANCGQPNAQAADSPGDGRYEVRDYTLILRYDDGRVSRRSISATVGGDPRKDASQIFVIGQGWRRRSLPLSAGVPVARSGRTITFDRLTFEPPPGEVQQTATAIAFTSIDRGRGTFCMISVFATTPGGATPAQDFAAEWQQVVKANHPVDADPAPAAMTGPAGLPFQFGGSLGGIAGERFYLGLLVFSTGGRRFSILLSSVDEAKAEACLPTLAPTLSSLRVTP